MRDKAILEILAILAFLVMIGSCAAMPSAGDISESDRNSSPAMIYMLENEGYNTTIHAAVDNVSDGGIHQESIIRPFDHRMCSSVDEHLDPLDRTTRFCTDDEVAICWFKASNVHEWDSFTVEWYDPYDRLYAEETIFSSYSGTVKFASFLFISGWPAAYMPGDWHVNVDSSFGISGFTEHFTISPRLPDLVITDIWWSGSTIYYKIKNDGLANAEASYTSLSVDERLKASDYVAPLGPGAVRTENFTYNWTFTPPEDKIRACADHRNDVTEIDETNNCKSKTCTYIQFKIDAANPGDTIIIKDGIYNDNIEVNKRLTIRSENGSANCIVQAVNPNDHVFRVTADYVNISGFTVKGATESGKAGIYLYISDYCNISSNNCSNNLHGIYLDDSNNNRISNNNCSNNEDGIYLRDSNNNRISNNNCSNNLHGISLLYSDNNSISNNNCSNNDGSGIYLKDSNNNKLKDNVMLENGIVILGDSLSEYMHEIDESNTVNGKPVYYWKDIEGGTIPDGAGQVILVNCSNVIVQNQNLNNATTGIKIAFSSYTTVKNNNCSNSDSGISLVYSKKNSISNNNCSNNDGSGIYLKDSNNNSISNNTCSNNRWCGIYLYYYSNSNLIYLNNFINNADNVYSFLSTNIWNSKEKITYMYNGSTYESYLGNYWDDYMGNDTNNDGIGDTPYSIARREKQKEKKEDKDNYPLMEPFKCYLHASGTPPEEEWSKTFGGTGTEVALSVQQTADGGYILARATGSNGGDFWLIKVKG